MSDDAGDEMPVNGPQRRHFEVVLASLENALVHVETLARADSPDARRLTQVEHDLPAGMFERMVPRIAALREHLSRLAAGMRLEAHVRSEARTINALLTSQIVHIQDSYAHTLRGYGDVDPRLAAQLDPVMESIERELVALRAELRHGAASGPPTVRGA